VELLASFARKIAAKKGTPARMSKADTHPSHRGILQAQARAEEQFFNSSIRLIVVLAAGVSPRLAGGNALQVFG
jgi:hypothetical protein